jgi:hypothetical protein
MAGTDRSGRRALATGASRQYVTARWVTGDGVAIHSRRDTTGHIDKHRATVGTSGGSARGIDIARSMAVCRRRADRGQEVLGGTIARS